MYKKNIKSTREIQSDRCPNIGQSTTAQFNAVNKNRDAIARVNELTTYIKNAGDALGLEELAAGSIVEAAQVEELRQDLGGEGADVEGGVIGAGGHAVAADAADLPLLELVVVAANPAGILSLSLPHNREKRGSFNC